MILRLVEPSSGEIRLLSRPLTGPQAIGSLEFRRLVQPIFQNPFEAFSAYLPVETYLRRTALNLKVAETDAQAGEAADEALHSVGLGLDRVRGKFVRQFSGGELQRISVARALIPNPKLIVADEPVSMVDASMRMNIVNLFRQIVEAKGVSFIYITHDLSTAYYLSDHVSIMKSGRIVEQGKPAAILDHPSDAYTRELMAAIPTIGVRWSEMEALDRDPMLPGPTTGAVTHLHKPQAKGGNVTEIAFPRPRLLPALAIGLSVLLGTTGLVAPARAQEMTDVDTPRDDTLIVDMLNARVGNPTNMNMYQQGVTINQGFHQLASALLYDIDTAKGEQIPDLAAAMPEALDDNFTKFRVKLREGLTWSDGQPFTADDVVFTAEMIRDTPDFAYSAAFTNASPR